MVVLALMIVGFAFIGNRYFSAKPCVPFAQKNVPDENDGSWKLDATRNEYSAAESEPYLIKKFYGNKKANGLSLGVYSYFGQIAYKSWACMPGTRFADVEDAMVSILKDGRWYKTKPGAQLTLVPHISTIRDSSSNIAAMEIAIIDESGSLVHVIHRPN